MLSHFFIMPPLFLWNFFAFLSTSLHKKAGVFAAPRPPVRLPSFHVRYRNITLIAKVIHGRSFKNLPYIIFSIFSPAWVANAIMHSGVTVVAAAHLVVAISTCLRQVVRHAWPLPRWGPEEREPGGDTFQKSAAIPCSPG